MKKIFLLNFLLLIGCSVTLSNAQTLGEKYKLGQLYYKITSQNPKEVAVTPQKDNTPYWNYSDKPSGDISIPNQVNIRGVIYTVTKIENYALFNCPKITSVSIPNSVKKLSSSSFEDCHSLKSFNVDAENPIYTSYGGVLFNKEKTIIIKYPRSKEGNQYTISNSIRIIGDNAFRNSKLKSITVPNSVKKIEAYAFKNCNYLQSINIPLGIKTIENHTFSSCKSLLNINIPESVTSIGKYAFYSCSSLTSVTLPNNIEKIKNYAFRECSSLKSINIPNSVNELGTKTFIYCSSLTSITSQIRNLNKVEMGIKVFEFVDKNQCTLTVPKGKKRAYKKAEQWEDFINITEM